MPASVPVPARHSLAGETLLSMSAAAKLAVGRGGDKPPALMTLRRWITVGVRGPDGRKVRLEAYRQGWLWVTTAEALDRFFAALTGGVVAGLPRPQTAAQRKARLAKAEAEAEAMGI